MKSILRAWNFVSLLLVGLVSCQMSPPGGSPPPGMTPSSSSNNSCTQYMNCVSDDSNSMVTFDHHSENDTVLIDMTTTAFSASGWMAVAFSYNDQMENDSVIDCILLKNGTIIVRNSYNTLDATNNTEIPEPQLGIQVVNTSYAHGVLQCALRRSITVASSSNKIFNLTRPYYILIATGPVDDQGNKLYHGNTSTYASPNAVDVTSDFLVPRERHYFLDTSKNFVRFAYIPSAVEMEFEIQGPVTKTDRWISLGFSNDTYMSDDSVLDCLLLTNNSVVVQNSFNRPNYTGNQPLNSTEGITVIKTSIINGWLYCAFRRKIANISNPQIFPLDKPYYLFLGDGNLNADGSGKKSKHSHTPAISAYPVDVRMVLGNVSRRDAVSPSASSTMTLDNACTQPMNCVSFDVKSAVIFNYQQGDAQILINMTTKAVTGSGWMGLGFSYDREMGDDSVIDCILMKNGTIIVKYSYNVPGVNMEIPDASLGIQVISTSSANGTLQCIFKRSITVVSSSNRIFNLTQPYYILIATGTVDDQGIKQRHSNASVSSNAVDVTSDFLVPRNRHYFLDTQKNLVTFAYIPSQSSPNSQVGSDTGEMEFEIQGPVDKTGRWISLGLSNDAQMSDDSVLDCLLLTNNSVVVQNSFNRPNYAGNQPLDSSEGITVIKTSIINGWLYCAFRRKIANFSNPQIYPLDKPYYLFLGHGNLNEDGSGTKVRHGHTPAVSASPVDVRTASGNVSRSDEFVPTISTSPLPTTATPGYSVFSNSNTGDKVEYKLSDDGNSVEFVISGQPQGQDSWIAVGFSYDQAMGEDSAIDCIRLQNGTFIIQNSYNVKSGDVRSNEAVNADGIKSINATYSGSQMSCRLTRTLSSDNPKIFPFNQTYYLLLASGAATPSGQKNRHTPDRRTVSSDMLNLTAYQGNIGSSQTKQLLRAHGCLMITAFVMLMCGAILIARYYKTCWPEDKLCNTAVWFAVHRFIMVTGLFCCAAGFIIIFCYSKGKLNREFGDNSPSYFWAHGPMGIAVMILIAMNPLIALFRCDPDSERRWIFNWMHWFVGTCCQILAGITLFFGIKMGESDNYRLNHFSVFWILIAFVGFHVFIELLLLLEKCISHRHSKNGFTVSYGMSSPGEPASAVKHAGDVSRESLLFRYFILAVYVLITMGLWLAMIILIGGGFHMGSN